MKTQLILYSTHKIYINLMWKEDGQNYSGQGHRRNMLGDYTKIGIAYTYDENSTYKYYWTMILVK